MRPTRAVLALCALAAAAPAAANPPVAGYVFPAGGQRGTTVSVRVGGLFLHDRCGFDLSGPGAAASPRLTPARRLWFEGPLLPLPESQQQEDYPADMAGTVTIAKDAPTGARRGRLVTSQGAAGGLVFVVGDLPEVVETETDGDPIPERITLPVTANGRIFPRDDVDLWEFDAVAGQTITAFAHAQSLHSPLVPRLDVLDAAGKVLAETMTYPVAGADASVRFTAPAGGKYRVRITDARSQGGPQYVYRLTITAAKVPDYEFPLKATADGLAGVIAPHAEPVKVPVALNGRITKPGDADEWHIELKKGAKVAFEVQARKLGSPLCAVVIVRDAAGKELARAEGADPATDPALAFQAPADGVYTVRVTERFRGRGGPHFAYRLRATEQGGGTPGFRLAVGGDPRQPAPADTLSVLRGGSAKLKLAVERSGGFAGPIPLTIDGLPEGVTASPAAVPANANAVDLTFTAKADARVQTARLTISGKATHGGSDLTATAVVPGNLFLPDEPSLFLAVGLPTPFKIVDQYVMTSAPRGEVYRRKYRIERNGFDGPIEVQLADKQARHLQGVTGPVVVVPPGQSEVEYPAFLPPWMEMGRTCRVCVMAVGKVKDADGREHAVSFSSVDQNQQMIVVVGPGRLDLELGRLSVRAEPGGVVRVPVKVSRGTDLSGPVKVEVVVPEHWTGVTAEAVTVAAGEQAGEVVLRFARECGPFNMPLTLRATAEAKTTPVTAEAKLEVVR
jgi:hypothetical protein